MSNFIKWIAKKFCKMEEIMLKLSQIRHNHHHSGVKMLAKFIRLGFWLIEKYHLFLPIE